MLMLLIQPIVMVGRPQDRVIGQSIDLVQILGRWLGPRYKGRFNDATFALTSAQPRPAASKDLLHHVAYPVAEVMLRKRKCRLLFLFGDEKNHDFCLFCGLWGRRSFVVNWGRFCSWPFRRGTRLPQPFYRYGGRVNWDFVGLFTFFFTEAEWIEIL